ncbi:MAG TPA: YceD family protein, partial [Gammaproteobacteria bacterium]|nr:YceD family protein [Gammaproteobacteria bacterium]
LPPEYEPLPSGDGRVAIAELVADELLLALPLVPKHGDGEVCEVDQAVAVHETPAAAEESRKNPFAELAKLKRGR